MGGTFTKIELESEGSAEQKSVLVVLTVPHAMCLELQAQAAYNNMKPDQLIETARILDKKPYGDETRISDRRAVQAALLLRAYVLRTYENAQCVIFAGLDQRQTAPEVNRLHDCLLENRVRAAMPALLRDPEQRRVNLDVHSYDRRGVGVSIATGDRRNVQILTQTGNELHQSSLEGGVTEGVASQHAFFMNLFTRTYNMPSAIVEFNEDKSALSFENLNVAAMHIARWAILEQGLKPRGK